MSIYPVYLAGWFSKKPKSYYTDKEYGSENNKEKEFEECRNNHENVKMCVEYAKCHNCGEKCTWKKAWGHHAISWGHGDVWCSKKCLLGGKK